MQNWTKRHPSLQGSFYDSLSIPTDESDAKLKQTCHLDAVEDIKLQLNVLEQEIEIEKIIDQPNSSDRLIELHEKKIKMINAQRYHRNASRAYWYCQENTVS
jgi:hypothetical protein